MKTKYNMTKVDRGAIRFVFVTRGRSKPFTQDEVDEFFSDNAEVIVSKPSAFRVPDDRGRRNMFLNDLKKGIHFCVDKYGVTQDEIVAEANRIRPYTAGA